jgi:hypothetical protein
LLLFTKFCSVATAVALLASEVTPGLLAGAEPDAHQFLCHGLINGVIKWVKTQEDKTLTQETGPGMYASKGGLDPTSVSKWIKG